MKHKTESNTRLSPEQRRQDLIEAVLQCIVREGHEGLSVRKVCQQAGVSAGLLTHHFSGKEELITAAYRHLTQDIYARLNTSIAQSNDNSALDKLKLYIQGSFQQPVLNKDYLKVWLVFWSLSQKNEEIARLRNEVNDTVISTLEDLIKEASVQANISDLNTRLSAIGLSALMDGLWLEWSLNPNSFSPQQAIIVCHGWVNALFTGSFDLS